MPDQDNICTCSEQPLVPIIVEVIDIIDRTPDVKSFFVKNIDGEGLPFQVAPGQCGMVSHLPIGEAMISCTWQEEQEYLEFAIKRVGLLTDELHQIEVGQKIGVRGPYGNGFPVEACKGRDMVFIAAASAWRRCAPLSNTASNTAKIMVRSPFSTAAAVRPTFVSKRNSSTSGPRSQIRKYL